MSKQCGELEIHVELNEISGPGGRVRLEPQAMAVLELLSAEPGRVWSRDELLREAWPGRIVADATLTGVVSRLRGSLRKAGCSTLRIESVSKRGYRLLLREDAKTASPRRKAWLAVPAMPVLVILAAFLFLRPQPLTALDGIRLDFAITFPDGRTDDATVWLENAAEGSIRMDGEHPLAIRVVPSLAANGLLKLRIETTGFSHWSGFEQVVGLDTESRYTLQSADGNAEYDIRFTASLADSPGVP